MTTPFTPDPEWLYYAYQELLVREINGPEHNPRILEYHLATALHATADEVAWCASFVGWCLRAAGKSSSYSAAARSYLWWGEPLTYPRPGAIAVFSRGPLPQPGPQERTWRENEGWRYPPGHVGFWLGFSSGTSHLILSGNSNDQVEIQQHPHHRLLGLRWP